MRRRSSAAWRTCQSRSSSARSIVASTRRPNRRRRGTVRAPAPRGVGRRACRPSPAMIASTAADVADRAERCHRGLAHERLSARRCEVDQSRDDLVAVGFVFAARPRRDLDHPWIADRTAPRRDRRRDVSQRSRQRAAALRRGRRAMRRSASRRRGSPSRSSAPSAACANGRVVVGQRRARRFDIAGVAGDRDGPTAGGCGWLHGGQDFSRSVSVIDDVRGAERDHDCADDADDTPSPALATAAIDPADQVRRLVERDGRLGDADRHPGTANFRLGAWCSGRRLWQSCATR